MTYLALVTDKLVVLDRDHSDVSSSAWRKVVKFPTPRSPAGSSRSRRKRERKDAELLDSDTPLSSKWIPRDRETVT